MPFAFSALLLLVGGMWQIQHVKMSNVPRLVQQQIVEAILTKFFYSFNDLGICITVCVSELDRVANDKNITQIINGEYTKKKLIEVNRDICLMFFLVKATCA